MTDIAEQLTEAVQAMRARLDGKNEYEQIWLDQPEAGRLRETMNQGARTVQSLREQLAKAQRRIRQLESSNGALIVDRDRAQRAAGQQVGAMRELLVKHLGLDSDELDEQIREQAECGRHVWSIMDGECRRYDEFRCAMVSLAFELERAQGLTADQVAKLVKLINKANKKALNR
jgi:small-conductance mechanosensitive channel